MVRRKLSAHSAIGGFAVLSGLTLALSAPGSALAQADGPPGAPYAHGDGPAAPSSAPPPAAAPLPSQPVTHDDRYEQAHLQIPGREAWLAECRQRMGFNDRGRRNRGVGGALIGGAIGGLAGNRIAGRGNRTGGTIAGAAVGAVAGAVIDSAGDRRSYRDECETYLDDYYAGYARYGYGASYGSAWPHYGAYGHAHPAVAQGADGCCRPMVGPSGPYMMVPVMMAPRGEPKCTETVEYIEEAQTPARRVVPPRARPQAKPVPDKRVRVK